LPTFFGEAKKVGAPPGAHPGQESYKHARHTATLGVAVHRLPSTSPANASWSFERKLAAWRSVCEQHGLI
jgi:G:T/U-mismatch repair DNA glycosylase